MKFSLRQRLVNQEGHLNKPHFVQYRLIFTQMDAYDDIDPNSRRTRINIATSCISTIFLCTWVAFHPNIPGLGEPKWKVIRRRIGCMIGGILAPEIYVLLAARQFLAARVFAKTYRRRGWTLTHGFFALMGGFIIYNGEIADQICFYDPSMGAAIPESLKISERRLATRHPESSNSSSPTPSSSSLSHSLAALRYIRSNSTTFGVTLRLVEQEFHVSIERCIGRLQWYNLHPADNDTGMDPIRPFYLEDQEERELLEGILTFLESFERHTITAAPGKSEFTDYAHSIDIADVIKEPISDHISDSSPEISGPRSLVRAPRISEQGIQDKSKSDMLTKTIALFQVAWFIIQLCARYHEKLAITELETITLAFCVLNFATYALWWKKPFTVDRGYAIRWRDDDWEVSIPPAPPFVETSQIPWYRSYQNMMDGIVKGIKQVLTMHTPFRTAHFAYQEVPDLEEDPLSHHSSVETFSPSSQLSQFFASIWQKVEFALSGLAEGLCPRVWKVFVVAHQTSL
ncbi:hypothetical protein NLI96_g7543 [Meripilus lineatus]|uniref:Nitric oxide synthase (NOS) domain-containing protein n=1 Tax=Meripilus lineatus TaxID=2056292 RepID=A0AAD5UZ27_9APHY|nr:hypothetical protein NLI96_g7543 [Physisporinus lineatus]